MTACGTDRALCCAGLMVLAGAAGGAPLEPIMMTGTLEPQPTISDERMPIAWLGAPAINAQGDIAFSWGVQLPIVGLIFDSLAVVDAEDGFRTVGTRGDSFGAFPAASVGILGGFSGLNVDDRGLAFAQIGLNQSNQPSLYRFVRENLSGDFDAVGFNEGPSNPLPEGVALADPVAGTVRHASSGGFVWENSLIVDGADRFGRGVFANFGGSDSYLLARTGVPAPGLGPTSIVRGFLSGWNPLTPAHIADNNTVSFIADVWDPENIQLPGRRVLYRGTGPDDLNIIAQGRSGQPAPGIDEPGILLRDIHTSAIGETGQVLYLGEFYDENAPPSDFETVDSFALILDDPSRGPRVIARTGEAIPGANAPSNNLLHIPREGSLVLAGPDRGIFTGLFGDDFSDRQRTLMYFDAITEPTAVISELDQAPGFEEGVLVEFASVSRLNNQSVAIVSALLTTDVTAWYSWTPWGELELIVAPGQVVDANPDPDIVELRTIAFVAAAPSALSDTNRFTFLLRFEGGGSGVFVTTVPAPGAAGVLLAGGCWAARRRRRG